MAEKLVPTLFGISMYPTVSLDSEELINQYLDVFESDEKFVPIEWGDSELIKLDYCRTEAIKRVSDGKVSELYLHRNKSIKYTGYVDVQADPRSYLSLKFDKTMSRKYWSQFFELSNQLANIVRPRFGSTHIFWPAKYPWNNEREHDLVWMNISAQPIPVRFLPNGPLGLGMRTYFGGHVLEMLGRDFLKRTPAIVTELEWGGICIDLLEESWEADVEEVLDIWLKVMDYFCSSKAFAIPSFDEDRMGVSFSPNQAWEDYLKS